MTGESLAALIEGLRDSARRERAAAALLRELERRVYRRWLSADDDRQEVVQRVAIKLLTFEIPAGARVEAYVQKMLRHEARTVHRERTRRNSEILAAPDSPELEGAAAIEGDHEEGVLLEQFRERFEGLLEAALALRDERYRTDLERDVRQLFDLAAGVIDVGDALSAMGAPPDGEPRERKRALDRMAKRHQRAREALDEAIAHLEQLGTDPEEVAEMRAITSFLLRCQRRDPRRVDQNVDREAST